MQQASKQQASKQQSVLANAEAVRDDEERVTFRLVEDLQGVGVNVADIKKLQEAGYMTIGNRIRTNTPYRFFIVTISSRICAAGVHSGPTQHQGPL